MEVRRVKVEGWNWKAEVRRLKSESRRLKSRWKTPFLTSHFLLLLSYFLLLISHFSFATSYFFFLTSYFPFPNSYFLLHYYYNSCKTDTKLYLFPIANKAFIWFTVDYTSLIRIKNKNQNKKPFIVPISINQAAYSSQKKSLFLHHFLCESLLSY